MNDSLNRPSSLAASYDDLLALPDGLIGEIIEGTLHTQPRPSIRHARAASALIAHIQPPYDLDQGGPGGWLILFEPELHLGEGPQVLVPDLAGWRRERLPRLPDAPWIDQVPDWVCEIISLATATRDRAIKMPLYRRLGVSWLWLVDPEHQTLEAYRSDPTQGYWLLLGAWGGGDQARIPPFAAISLPLGSLWI